MEYEDSFSSPNDGDAMDYNCCIRRRYKNISFEEIVRNVKQGLVQKGFDTINEYVLHEYFYQLIEEKVGRSIVLVADKPKRMEINPPVLSSCNIIIMEAENRQFIEITVIDPTALVSMDDPETTLQKNDIVKEQFKAILDQVERLNSSL